MTATRTTRTVVAAALAAGLTVTALAAPALAASPAAPAPAAPAKKGHAATQAALDANVAAGVPGAVAQARVDGRSWT
ncbi:peptidase, partial [Streptomyces sp. NPDC056049]